MTAARLLAGVEHGPLDLAAHRAVHGELAVVPGPILADETRRARLRGRGGGGFPLVRKLEAVTRAAGRPQLVVNGCEGDPLSAKDRVLLTLAPHLVIDGAVHLARAIATREILIALPDDAPETEAAIRDALAQRTAELRAQRLDIGLLCLPGAYVSGQETALVRFSREGDARPLTIPPRVTERGIARRPTLVSNAETVAQVAVLAARGGSDFAAVGTPDEPGTALVTLGGAVVDPGVYEIAHGTTLASLVAAAGGASETAEAVLVGGCAGTWLPAGAVRGLRLSRDGLRAADAALGLGAIVVLGRGACPTAELAHAATWLAARSAGQCGPCTHGLAAIAAALGDVRDGTAAPDALGTIDRWAGSVTGRGACAHPDGTARFVASGLRTFAADLADHLRHGRCDACERAPVLALPEPATGYRVPAR